MQWKEKDLPHPSFFGSPQATPLSSPEGASLCIIGPESGLAPKEEKHLERIGAQKMCFHPNTLRAETAALTAIHWMGARTFFGS